MTAPFTVVAGEAHTCALGSTGALRCWGANHAGQLGIATTATCAGYACAKLPPAPVLEGVASIAVGGSSTCAVLADHTVRCFGDDRERKLGFGGPDTCSTGPCAKTPVTVPGLTASAMAVGHTFSCALGTTGAVSCVGANSIGEVGSGATTPATTFTAVTLPRPAIALAAGAYHACALLDDRTVACWGSNQQGQLGTPTDGGCTGGASCSRTPLAVAGLTDVVAITAGSQHTCARRADRTVWCWGSNQVGQAAVAGDTCLGTSCSKTTRLVSIGAAFEVAAGWSHTCARLVDGTVRCWGDNFAGQIGVPSTSTCGRPFDSCVPAPTVIPGVTEAARLALGGGYSCVLQQTSGALCWGSNALGQFGDGSTASTTVPAPVTW